MRFSQPATFWVLGKCMGARDVAHFLPIGAVSDHFLLSTLTLPVDAAWAAAGDVDQGLCLSMNPQASWFDFFMTPHKTQSRTRNAWLAGDVQLGWALGLPQHSGLRTTVS